VVYVMQIHPMIVHKIVQVYGVAMQLNRPIILILIVMDWELVIQVHTVMLTFQMDGL